MVRGQEGAPAAWGGPEPAELAEPVAVTAAAARAPVAEGWNPLPQSVLMGLVVEVLAAAVPAGPAPPRQPSGSLALGATLVVVAAEPG